MQRLFLASLLFLTACAKDATYLVVYFADSGAPPLSAVKLDFQLGDRTDSVTLSPPPTFPSTKTFQIDKGDGQVEVSGTALDPNGLVAATATGSATVSKKAVAALALTFRFGDTQDLAPAADLTAPLDLSLPPDAATPPDSTSSLPVPTLTVTAPGGAIYELGSDGKTPYVWTVSATQIGAATAPVVTADAASLPAGMIPVANGLGQLELRWLPSYRQTGNYTITVHAQSTADGSMATPQDIAITVHNTVDPIADFYEPNDAKVWGAANEISRTVYAIGDFNGDGFDDVVHVVRRRTVQKSGSGGPDQATSFVKFYVLLGGATGFVLPATDDDSHIALPNPGVRRLSLSHSRDANGAELLEAESFPPRIETSSTFVANQQITSARMFPAGASDHGREIFFVDPRYVNQPSSDKQTFAQIYGAASNAPDGAALLPMLDEAMLMPGYACPPSPYSSCYYETPLIFGADLDGDQQDELIGTYYLQDTAKRTRLVLYAKGQAGEPVPISTGNFFDAGGSFPMCTGATVYDGMQPLGVGSLLPGVGDDYAFLHCDGTRNANVITISDGKAGYPNLDAQTFYLDPKGPGLGSAANQPEMFHGICDVDGDGIDDLYRWNQTTSPYVVDVLLNSGTAKAFPLTVDSTLDPDAWKSVTLPAPPEVAGQGNWQWIHCIRGAGQSVLVVSRGYDWYQAKYDVRRIVVDGAGELALAAPPWPSLPVTWPGDAEAHPSLGRPSTGGDFDGDGKLDVITTASIQDRFLTSVVYGR